MANGKFMKILLKYQIAVEMKVNFYSFTALIVIIHLFTLQLNAQERVVLNPGVYDNWNNLERPIISNNGIISAYEINPQLGDGFMVVINPEKTKSDTIQRATEAIISPANDYIAFKVKPMYKDVRKAKLDGKKKDDLPKDSLGISTFNGREFRFPDLKSFNLPENQGKCLAALCYSQKPETAKDSLVTDSISGTENELQSNPDKQKDKSAKKKDKTEIYTLKLIFPADSIIHSWDSVTSYALSDNGRKLAWASYRNDSVPFSSVSLFETVTQHRKEIFNGIGQIRSLTFDTTGSQLSFLYSSDTSEVKRYKLLYYKNEITTIADTSSPNFPDGFCSSENGKLWFSADGSKLYFGIAPTPRPEPKDTLTDDEKARVDVWHWQDPLIQPQQLKQLDSEKKRTYLTVFHPKSDKIVRLANEEIKTVQTGYKGNGRFALGFADDAYRIESSWKDASYRDVYLIDNETGARELLLRKHNGAVSLSTTQKFFAWYNQQDSLWYTMNLKDRIPIKQSAGKQVAFYDEEHDVPSLPGPAGYAGWTENDRLFVVYDLFDLWGLDPTGKKMPENMTNGEGRKTNTRFRNIAIYNDKPFMGYKNTFLLSAFNETTKDGAFFRLTIGKQNQLIQLETGPFKYSNPTRSKNSDKILWTKGNFQIYPDLWISDLDFSKQQKLSDANPQQKNYLWGSVELVKWTMPDGKEAEGLLYKPANFDPSKKYPMLVYFYEKYSDQLHQHYVPKPSRSIISPTYCSSNGYLVFIPDIRYHDGYPGQSALDAIISGTNAITELGFVDSTRMGLQGQSWGGYQTAWLVTRTNKFRAAMAGAPVSNMTSAYGGIRWESGMVRAFQYEEGQSRIGATLWERPDLYLENSPLFGADKVETPLLIMSNDGDGAVPWYQGIELYSALRRLGKPAWLLNYNGDEHNLARRANMKDLDTRMMQFFDYYLKDAPAPQWLINGLPALDKGKKTGFDPVKEVVN